MTITPKTPVTSEGLSQFDDLEPSDAVKKAWLDEGSHPEWHRQMQNVVRDSMPVLARHLDRL